MRLKLLQPEPDAPLGRVHFQDLDIQLLAHREHVGRFIDVAPGNVGHVQQSIHAADVDKRAVFGEAADGAVHHRAFLQIREQLLAGDRFFLFQHRTPVHHHVFVGHVQLDDAAGDLLAHQLFHLGYVFSARPRRGHERADAHVHAQAALHHARDHARNGALFAECGFQRRPVLGPLHAYFGEIVITLLVAPLDGHRELVAYPHAHRAGCVFELGYRHDAFDLVADVDEDLLRRNGYHRAGETLAAGFGFMCVGMFVLGQDVREVFAVFGHGWRIILFQRGVVGHETT